MPPPGSRRRGPRRLLLQLPLPYKAGAGPRRGRSCGRPASSSALGAARGRQGAQRSAAGAEERAEPAMGKSGEPAVPAGPGCGDGSEPQAPGSSLSLFPRWAGSPGSGSTASAGVTRFRPRSGTTGCGMEGLATRAISGAARKPGWPSGPRERGRKARPREGPLSASQRLRQGGPPGADGISAQRPAKAWLLLCFRTGLELEKATEL